MVLCLTGPLLVGVFVAERGGGGPLMELPGRDSGCCLAKVDLVVEGGAEGVLERGGGFAATGVKASRYRSPWTRNGRPNSSSQCSNSLRRSASSLGNSF